MKIILFTHPSFLNSTSMPLFAQFLQDGLKEHGHDVDVWSPAPFFHRLPFPRSTKKWLGYLDQYFVFPFQVRRRIQGVPQSTLFVFADQALGPWVPLVANRPHVVHCHDFLALRSALGEISRNRVLWTGRIYQKWIKSGFRKGRNFISISERTRAELHRFLNDKTPAFSAVVYNGLNHPYRPLASHVSHARLLPVGSFLSDGFILHVGGNQWYKNRAGVLAIYDAYVKRCPEPLPLLMIGAEPTAELRTAALRIFAPGRVEFVVRPSTETLEAAYSAAAVLLFPSHAEGFGWPILEAMASGCPVLTTNDTPMIEVGGDVASYLPLAPEGEIARWADECASRLGEVLSRSAEDRVRLSQAGIARAQDFTASATVQRYLDVYKQVLDRELAAGHAVAET
jgi:glycosyltransferase involved in cell wall biosynthesis